MKQELASVTSIGETMIMIDGKSYDLFGLDPEPHNRQYDYRVQSSQLRDQTGRTDTTDLAIVTVSPNGSTPLQIVERAGLVFDIPVRGKGTFLSMDPAGHLWMIPFDEEDPNNSRFGITYNERYIQTWIAGQEDLVFAELCTPPYKKGDFRDLDLEHDSIPELFLATYRSLMSSQQPT